MVYFFKLPRSPDLVFGSTAGKCDVLVCNSQRKPQAFDWRSIDFIGISSVNVVRG